MPNQHLDRIAWRILDRLQRDARISNADLACEVGLSPSPCLRRVRELEQSGTIKDYVTLLEPAADACGFTATRSSGLRTSK